MATLRLALTSEEYILVMSTQERELLAEVTANAALNASDQVNQERLEALAAVLKRRGDGA